MTGVGVGLYASSLLFDWVHGAMIIEEKRARVNYKYRSAPNGSRIAPDG